MKPPPPIPLWYMPGVVISKEVNCRLKQCTNHADAENGTHELCYTSMLEMGTQTHGDQLLRITHTASAALPPALISPIPI